MFVSTILTCFSLAAFSIVGFAVKWLSERPKCGTKIETNHTDELR